MELGFNDIRFNFIINSCGIFEGRGWDVKPELGNIDEPESLLLGFHENLINEENTAEIFKTALDDLILRAIILGKVSKEVKVNYDGDFF